MQPKTHMPSLNYSTLIKRQFQPYGQMGQVTDILKLHTSPVSQIHRILVRTSPKTTLNFDNKPVA